MGFSYVSQTEIHTSEPLVPEASASGAEMVIKNLNRYKSPCINKIPAELIKAEGRVVCSQIHKLIWDKKELLKQWKESIIVPIDKKGDKTGCSNYRSISHLSATYKILSSILLSRLTPYAE
jgi:hypothetical protein